MSPVEVSGVALLKNANAKKNANGYVNFEQAFDSLIQLKLT